MEIGRTHGAVDQVLLDGRDLGKVDLNAHIAAGNHDAVGHGQNLVDVVDALLVLDLRDDADLGVVLVQDVADIHNVLRVAGKAGGDQVKALLDAKQNIARVALAHIRHGQMHAGNVDALLGLDDAVIADRADNVGVADLVNAQLDQTVVQHDPATGLDVVGQLLVSDGADFVRALYAAGGQGELAFSNIAADPRFLIMYAIAFVLLYLGIKKQYEPLLLVPIAFGVLLANFPGGDMGVVQADENGMVMVNGVMKNIWEMPLHEIAHELGLMNFIYYMLIKTGFLPPIIFMGVGALTDFGPMLRNLRLSIFGAAAQLGIFAVLLVSILMGFTPKEAASLGIIGGADGPTAIFTTIKLAPHLLGPIAIAAYSYMALVPVIVPLVVRLWCTKKELSINMKEQEKKYPSKTEIKNLRVLKIIFPIACTTIVALFVPSAVPLIGMLMFGNLVKEIGSNTSRLFDAASNSIMNAATIFLGISVGATMTTDAFLNWTTIGIVIGGFLAFALSISGGIFFVKIFNLFTKKKINPLIGATGLSAVPMASRVANEIALKYDPKNHVLQYCMASNISGVIGSAVAAGVLISFLG